MCYKPLFCKRDDNGVFVIHCAATHASREVLSILLEKGKDREKQNEEGDTKTGQKRWKYGDR